jgi:hypothetical protein
MLPPPIRVPTQAARRPREPGRSGTIANQRAVPGEGDQVTTTPWDVQGDAREALRIIVADPRYGPAALSNPQTMTNLLKDMLPDAPRESGVLVAASEAGVPGMLQGNVAQGMDWDTASRLAAGSLENRTALTAEACTWAVSTLGSALHLDAAAGPPPPGTVTAPETVPSGSSQQATTAPAARTGPGVPPGPAVSASRPKGLRIAVAVATAAGAILIVCACAPTLYHFDYSYAGNPPSTGTESLFSLSGLSPRYWGWAIPPVAGAVLGVAAAVLFLVAHSERLRGLATGMLLAFGIATALIWLAYEFLYRYSIEYASIPSHASGQPGPAEIVGILGGLLLIAAALVAVAGRETKAAAPGP